MSPVFVALFALLASTFRTRAAQQAEIVALRHQIAVLQRNAPRRLRLKQSDRLLWILLSRFWSGWTSESVLSLLDVEIAPPSWTNQFIACWHVARIRPAVIFETRYLVPETPQPDELLQVVPTVTDGRQIAERPNEPANAGSLFYRITRSTFIAR